jgi:ATP-dependent Lon protease
MNDHDFLTSSNELPGQGELALDLDCYTEKIPEFMHLLPMAELNSFPGLSSTIAVDERVSRMVVNKSDQGDKYMALFALKSLEVDTENLIPSDFYPVGVAARICRVRLADDGLMKVMVKGISRITFTQILTGDTPVVKVIPQVELTGEDYSTLKPLVLEAKRLYAEVLKLIPGLPVDLFKINSLLDGAPIMLADLIMASLPLRNHAKAEYLLIAGLKQRYLKLLEHLTLEVSNRKAGLAISQRIEEGLNRKQKEMILREQLNAIKVELGETDDNHSPLSRAVCERINSLCLPNDAKKAATREMERLASTPTQSSEHGVISHYLEWIAELPWGEKTEDNKDLALAREILDRDHYGLAKVKKRILEFLAVYKLTQGTTKTPILCLIGPPGVGKTSLGESISECLGRKFVRLSLGGLKDEAEIRGHRRTYVGARPGRVLSGLKKAGVVNPVFLLDELDKMGSGLSGDPGAALLEALDPEQNEYFTDHFLEIPFDLSKVLFVLTANVVENIPAPLRDRLEIIEIQGYTVEEKVEIANRHLIPKELTRHGLTKYDLLIPKDTLTEIINSYTWEAGVRELSRCISAVARSRSLQKAENEAFHIEIDKSDLSKILGSPIRRLEVKEILPQSGVVTGLAWTPAGGDIMFIEAVAMPGRGKLSLTGQLGEVMKESAQAAISYVRSRANDWFLDASFFQTHDFHVHLPQGAIPKDGPSAGVGLAASIVSLVTKKKVRTDLAMTGEISLRGLVLPVGGLMEKLLAAKRAGITTVLIPDRNLIDLKDFPEEVTSGLDIIPVSTLDQVLEIALINSTQEEIELKNLSANKDLQVANPFERNPNMTFVNT